MYKSHILLLLLVSIQLLSTLITASLTHQKTFTIKPDLENYKATVKLDNVVCSFKFSTFACSERKTKQQETEKEKKKILTYEEVIERLPKATCLQKVEGYWTYSFCFNGKIKQNHGNDMFFLGSFQQFKKDKALYGEGETCKVSGNKEVQRSTEVTLMCGSSSEIVSVREPNQCFYEMIVTDPSLCGEDSPFPTYHHETSTSSITESSIYDHFEIKIEKTMFQKEYLCTVQSILRDLKSKPTSCFSQFSMVLQGKKNKGPLTARAMHHGRVPFGNSELKYMKSGEQVTTTNNFDGSLDYIQVK